jgi:hypothetical protein
VALALVLLTGAAQLVQDLVNLVRADVGVETSRIARREHGAANLDRFPM